MKASQNQSQSSKRFNPLKQCFRWNKLNINGTDKKTFSLLPFFSEGVGVFPWFAALCWVGLQIMQAFQTDSTPLPIPLWLKERTRAFGDWILPRAGFTTTNSGWDICCASDHISTAAYCIIAVVQKLNPLRENIREYSYRLPDVTSKIRASSSYERNLSLPLPRP